MILINNDRTNNQKKKNDQSKITYSFIRYRLRRLKDCGFVMPSLMILNKNEKIDKKRRYFVKKMMNNNKQIIKWGLILFNLGIIVSLLSDIILIKKRWSYFFGYFQLYFNWNIWLIRIISAIFVFIFIFYILPNIYKIFNPLKPLSKKQIPALIIVCFLCILWFITYLSVKNHNFDAQGRSLTYKAWAVDHYENIASNCSVHPVYGTPAIKVTSENLSTFSLRKIEVDDNTVFFNPVDGTPHIYYYIMGSKVDFFNSKGIHPQYGEELKPVTKDFVKNYFLQIETEKKNVTNNENNTINEVNENKNTVDTLVELGIAHGKKGDINQAIANFNQAIRLDSNNSYAYYNRGYAQYLRGETDLAIADYSQAIKFDPDYVNSYISRGVIYADKREFNRAITDFETALRLEPDNSLVINNLELALKKAFCKTCGGSGKVPCPGTPFLGVCNNGRGDGFGCSNCSRTGWINCKDCE